MMLYPANTMADIASDPQLKSRRFWQEVEHPELEANIVYPGSFVKGSESPCYIRRRAPLIGEHNEEIYHGELNYSRDELIALKQAKVI